jgi:hypothetical protein
MVAPFDYAELLTDIDELMAEFGRGVQFVRTSSTPNDSAKPWRGEKLSEDVATSGIAAVVPFMSEDDRDSVRFGVKMVIVSASVFPSNDGELYDAMIDADGSRWHLFDAEMINPGDTRLLYTFKAEQ